MFLGTIGIFFTLYLLFARFFPVLALNELKSILKIGGELQARTGLTTPLRTMANKVIYAVYDDPEVLKSAARKLVSGGVRVRDVFSPFPVHGLDPIIGVKRTRLGIVSFMFGLGGLSLAIWAWLLHDAGLADEHRRQTELLAVREPACVRARGLRVHGALCRARHGHHHLIATRRSGHAGPQSGPRSTDDKFVMELRTEDNHGVEIADLLQGTHALEMTNASTEPMTLHAMAPRPLRPGDPGGLRRRPQQPGHQYMPPCRSPAVEAYRVDYGQDPYYFGGFRRGGPAQHAERPPARGRHRALQPGPARGGPELSLSLPGTPRKDMSRPVLNCVHPCP